MSIDQKIDMSSRLFQKQITFIEIRDENDAKENAAYLQKYFTINMIMLIYQSNCIQCHH